MKPTPHQRGSVLYGVCNICLHGAHSYAVEYMVYKRVSFLCLLLSFGVFAR